MAFLGFMKGKKQQPAATNQKTKEMPLPPSMGEDLNMPGFSDESHTDDLKLPEIPEIDTNQGPTMPDMPQQPVDDMSSFADMPGVPQIETPEPQQQEPLPEPQNPEEPLPEPPRAPERPVPPPELPPEPIPRAPERPVPPPELPPEPIPRAPEKKPEEPYDHTPIAKKPSEPGMPVAGPQEFYIKGEDYRELLSGLDMAMAKQKEKIMQAESDIFAVEEKEYGRFILTIEDLHRRLMLAETILFEERREK